jgi:hypothetical protein
MAIVVVMAIIMQPELFYCTLVGEHHQLVRMELASAKIQLHYPCISSGLRSYDLGTSRLVRIYLASLRLGGRGYLAHVQGKLTYAHDTMPRLAGHVLTIERDICAQTNYHLC